MFVANGAFAQIFFWLFLIEALSYFAIVEMLEGSGRKPGDFGAGAPHARTPRALWGMGAERARVPATARTRTRNACPLLASRRL